MKKYRATFYDGPNGNKHRKFDFEALSTDDAFAKAHLLLPSHEARALGFTDMMIEEVEDGPKQFGIRFSYEEGNRGRYYNYMVIRANDEAQATEYYNRHYRGKRFFQPWPHTPDEKGNCIYGEIAETYFAACPGYVADATKDVMKRKN